VSTPDATLRRAVVLAVLDTKVQLELTPQGACSGCEQRRTKGVGPGHCGIDLLGLSQAAQGARLFVPVPLDDVGTLKVGDVVSVVLPAASLAC